MEVRNNDGSIDLYDGEFLIKEFIKENNKPELDDKFSFGKLADAFIKQEGVDSVTIHKPESQIEIPNNKIIRLNNKAGEIIEQSDRRYIVQENGSWKRIT